MRLLPILILAACGASPAPVTTGPDTDAVGSVLDAWHSAAANADEHAYFAAFTDDAIFLGTDATERWTVAEFREYAHPHFDRGRAWVFRAVRRDVVVEGDLAWFDEDLDTEGLGPARGSGVLRREGGRWRIAHYNLAITVPNERFAEVKALLAGADAQADAEAGAEADAEADAEPDAEADAEADAGAE